MRHLGGDKSTVRVVYTLEFVSYCYYWISIVGVAFDCTVATVIEMSIFTSGMYIYTDNYIIIEFHTRVNAV